MSRQLIVYGPGQLGRLFGGAALRLDRAVVPITRSTDRRRVWKSTPEDTPILVSVDEATLADAVSDIPSARRREVILVQNELFSSVWRQAGLREPTVLVFWTLCKPGYPLLVGARSGAHGRHAALLAGLHEVIDVPCEVLGDTDARDAELAAKFALILTVNTLGVLADRSVGEWLEEEERVDAILDDALTLGHRMAGVPRRGGVLRERVWAALRSMAPMRARGRTASQRVSRALEKARRLNIAVPAVEQAARAVRDA